VNRIGLGLEQLRSPLARRLIVAIILVSSAITLVLTGWQLYGEYRGQLKEIDVAFRQVENVRLESLTQSLWTTSVENLRLQLQGIQRLPNLEYVAVREGEKLWAEAGRRTSVNVIERQYLMTHLHLGRTYELGTLTVVAGLDAIYRQIIARAFVTLANNALKTFLVAAFAFAFFHRLVNRHLTDIAKHLRGLDFGNRASRLLLARAARPRRDELDEAVAAINSMHESGYTTLTTLRESEKTLRLIVETIDKVFWMTDVGVETNFYISPGYERVWGRTRASLQENSRSFLEAVHPEDLDRVRVVLERQKSGQQYDHEYRIIRPDGTIRWIWDRGYPVRDATGKVSRYAGVAQDITERRRTLEEASRQRNQLATLSRRLAAVREQQSRDIARELHDRVGQNLTVLGINLTRLRDEQAAAPKTRARINDILAVIEATGKVISDVLTELKPPMLSDHGLLEALRWHVKQLAQRAGVAIKVMDSAAPRLAPEIEMAFFRIAQGALNNVVQHARARSVFVRLDATNGMAQLEVVDDGSGFDMAARSVSGSWGLTAMRERAEAIDGSLRIESAPGRGTRIVVEAPVGP